MHHKCRLSIGEITPGSRLIYDGVIAVCTDTGSKITWKNVDDEKCGCKWTLNIITSSFHQTIQQDRNACVCTSVVYDWCECKYFRIYPTHAHQRSGTNNQTQFNGISTRL
ncbi:hypothetical protein ALC56_05459 [Trachymyrmex septentrionalis]|uniref:Uncharacterized protein n=1 Tax=Trachymyrmex septentrionalis TaxID=34720 RepID=A0A195FKJ0_9HYME|nr:hypothetical protein ALC56_05459 [Trachymyrmex septentrionalis]